MIESGFYWTMCQDGDEPAVREYRKDVLRPSGCWFECGSENHYNDDQFIILSRVPTLASIGGWSVVDPETAANSIQICGDGAGTDKAAERNLLGWVRSAHLSGEIQTIVNAGETFTGTPAECYVHIAERFAERRKCAAETEQWAEDNPHLIDID